MIHLLGNINISRNILIAMAMAVCISEEIAREMSLPQQKREILHYGTLLHDIGMLSIPRELIETPRKLEPKEDIRNLQDLLLGTHLAVCQLTRIAKTSTGCLRRSEAAPI